MSSVMRYMLMTKLKPRETEQCLTEDQQSELCEYLAEHLLPDVSATVHYGRQFSGPETGVFFFQAVYENMEAYEEGARIISRCTGQFLRKYNAKPYQVLERSVWHVQGV